MNHSPLRNLPQFNEFEFTAQKKAQFRVLFPHKSESQITKMAIKQLEKQKKKMLESTNRVSTNQRTQHNTIQSSPTGAQQTYQQINPRARLDFYSNERIAVIVPQENANQQSPQASSTSTSARRTTRRIRKDTLDKYYNFCRHYRLKLRLEHPTWTSHQINTIINLLWRKKVTSGKSLVTSLTKPRFRKNVITGRKYFGNMKRIQSNMEGQEVRVKWCTLPQETRRYLNRLGGLLRPATDKDGFSHPFLTMPKTIKFKPVREQAFSNSLLSFINHN